MTSFINIEVFICVCTCDVNIFTINSHGHVMLGSVYGEILSE